MGTNLKLRPGARGAGITGLLFEPSASAPGGNYGYPFSIPGFLTINHSTLTAAPSNTVRLDLYYYFYNWTVVTGCESARTPVVATIAPMTTYYQDADMDTYGNVAVTQSACGAPPGYVSNSTDCNDTNAAVNPGAMEICNNLDDDCSGAPRSCHHYLDGAGNGTTWDDPANWSDAIVPLTCQNVVIPTGADVTVPTGFEGKGLTLDVATGALLTVPLTALLSIVP